MSATDDLVTTWKLDAKDLNKQMANVKAGFDLVCEAAGLVGKAFGTLLEEGGKLEDLLQNNSLSIDAAAKAAGGYVTKIDLLTAANKATTSGLRVTDQQFARLAQGAVLLSKRTGGDARQALDQMTNALSRNQERGLKGLGLLTDYSKALNEYAKAHGKTTVQLTAAEKQAVLLDETMRALDRTVGDQQVTVDNAADAWEVMQNKLKDAVAEAGSAVVKIQWLQESMQLLTDWISRAATAFGVFTSKLGSAEMGRAISIIKGLHADMPGTEWAKAEIPTTGWGKHAAGLLMGMDPMVAKQNIANLRKILGFAGVESGVTPEQAIQRMSAAQTSAEAGKGWWESVSEAIPRSGIGKVGGGGRGGRGGTKDKKRKKGKLYDIEGEHFGLASFSSEMNMETKLGMLGGAETTTETMTEAAKSIADMTEKYQLQRDAAIQAQQAQEKLNKSIADAPFDAMKDVALDFALGMVQVFDSVIQGEASFGQAMLSMLKSLAFSVMGMAAVQALQQYAEGTAALATTWGIPNPKSIAHFAAAGMFTALAAGAAVGGLGISGIQAATGAGASGGGSASSGGGVSRDYSSSFSGTKSTKAQPINISVYIGDPGDPSAALMMQKQLTAQLKKAA